MLCKRTHANYRPKLRTIITTKQSNKPKPINAVNNADRRRNFTNFNSQLSERIVAIKSESL